MASPRSSYAPSEPRKVVKDTGFTILQDGGSEPELDVVFVHGLQGHPEKTWSFQHSPKKSGSSSPVPSNSSQKTSFISKMFGGKKKDKKANDTQAEELLSPPNLEAKSIPDTIFWPRDLLSKHEDYKDARIMTYGYDTNIMSIIKTANFTTISGEGETLLNGLARIRADHPHRPLLFVTHSLGGLVVKVALNVSLAQQRATDLRAIEQSTFAIVFFGTPHRGSFYAENGMRAARAISMLTFTHFNDNILRNLADNTEILTTIRKSFDQTLDDMIENNKFQCSTFQEGMGFSRKPGFQSKIVEDDSSEMGNVCDRNDHINANHIDMCKFPDISDSEYEKVAGELKRHVLRVRKQISEEQHKFITSLEELGLAAIQRVVEIEERTSGTMDWIYSGTDEPQAWPGRPAGQKKSLGAWLKTTESTYWITGRPGSGKSTAMKSIYDNATTIKFLRGKADVSHQIRPTITGQDSHTQRDLVPDPDWSIENSKASSEIEELSRLVPAEACVRVGLFITDRGSQNQCSWSCMLHGILLQLLQAKPGLIHHIIPRMKKKDVESVSRRLVSTDYPVSTRVFDWSEDIARNLLSFCMKQAFFPIRMLILLDGLDELHNDSSVRTALADLENLCDVSKTSNNLLKVCISSRSEQTFLDYFHGVPHLEVHKHTRDDIRKYVCKSLISHPRFREIPESEKESHVERVIDYISDNSHGVFLWASSVTHDLYLALTEGEAISLLYDRLEKLPTGMHELYTYILRKIDPNMRQKAYIILEIVLRARTPLTIFDLSMMVLVTERSLQGKTSFDKDLDALSARDIHDLADPQRMYRQLTHSCRCILEASSRGSSFDGLHARAGYSMASENEFELLHDSYPYPMVWSHSTTWIPGTHDHQRLEVSDDRIETLSKHEENDTDSDLETPDTMITSGYLVYEVERIPGRSSADVELMEQAQFQDYSGRPVPDRSQDIVRLLHRSAREFLLRPGRLDVLFQLEGDGFTTNLEKPAGNGHTYILLFAKAWLKLPERLRSQLHSRFDIIQEVTHHASQIETTLAGTDLEPYYHLLDDIDLEASTKMAFKECWPEVWFQRINRGVTIPTWIFTFPAFAVAVDMRGYVQHLINEAEKRDDRDHFLNGKEGRPLLHFAVYLTSQEPKPEMARFLLQQGVDVHATFGPKTAIQSIDMYGCLRDGQPQLGMVKVLLENGADANSCYFALGTTLHWWYPLLHVAAHSTERADLSARLDLMRTLHKHGADLNAVDMVGRALLEILYWCNRIIPGGDWDWLLRKGARITKCMVSNSYYEPWYIDSEQADSPELREQIGWMGGIIDSQHRSVSRPRAAMKSTMQPEQSPLSRQEQALQRGSASGPLTMPSRGPCGICDRSHGSQLDGYQILRGRRFRKRAYYTDEAAKAAEDLEPGWFNV